MIFSKENVDELNAVISVKVSPEDFQPQLDKAIKDYAKKVQMPGFRKGMVPIGLVKKMYGKSIKADEINRLLSDGVNNYLVESKFDLLGHAMPRPMQNEIDWDNQNEFNFEYEIAFAPKFELDLSGESFTKRVVKIDDALISSHVQNIAKRYGKVTNPESVEKDDLVYLDFTELDAQGNVKEGGIVKNSPIALDMVPSEETRNKFVGQTIGFTIKLNPVALLKSPDELAHVLGINAEEANNVSSNFELKISNISRLSAAEMNEEFFAKIYGPSVKTEEEFKNKVREELMMMFGRDSERLLINQIQKRLLEKTNLPLPAEFLKRWIKAVNDKPITNEQIESEWPAYENSTRWQLIETKILTDNNITVTEQEVREYVEDLIRKQFVQYNMTEVNDDILNGSVENVMKNREEYNRVAQQLVDSKLMTLYQMKCTIAEQEMTEEEFYKS
jgi:trigger factor